MPVKLQDIPAELGLSVSTISCVVNSKEGVDPHTRQTVLKVLDEYGYGLSHRAIHGRKFLKGE